MVLRFDHQLLNYFVASWFESRCVPNNLESDLDTALTVAHGYKHNRANFIIAMLVASHAFENGDTLDDN